eukprot:TRINITY_DN11752_c0_g1_i1.p1 TRINITY_DN11752_c0_g1~~TRINITY_DN11752_c0_g1_i1.p1  ORF type:complete len:205 (+),score=30.64 TRINITY_DN11752_c0_g1_i1:743-1357(+)
MQSGAKKNVMQSISVSKMNILLLLFVLAYGWDHGVEVSLQSLELHYGLDRAVTEHLWHEIEAAYNVERFLLVAIYRYANGSMGAKAFTNWEAALGFQRLFHQYKDITEVTAVIPFSTPEAYQSYVHAKDKPKVSDYLPAHDFTPQFIVVDKGVTDRLWAVLPMQAANGSWWFGCPALIVVIIIAARYQKRSQIKRKKGPYPQKR